jgi:hypothetical protein
MRPSPEVEVRGSCWTDVAMVLGYSSNRRAVRLVLVLQSTRDGATLSDASIAADLSFYPSMISKQRELN